MKRNDLLIFVVLILVCFVIVSALVPLLNGFAGVSKTQAEVGLIRAQSDKASAEAVKASAEARKVNAEAHRLENELDRDKYGWTAVTVKENAGSLGSFAMCIPVLAVMFGLVVVLYLMRPRPPWGTQDD